ncbi:tRNA pseudouridine(38-40) synthase TruA [Enorma phocaeensis]|uniref:tRNA pseudouridine(38-40) synthase TruA n=1 Tax=Enorma phocaeensis TaxID=1871019 RepID=UPI000C8398DE|nr:tRNA pseudouridine(38-40) synthase TruA [Enorma phocaeensis]
MAFDKQEAGEGTIVLRVAYAGGAYSGFAEQPQPGVRTIAGELRRALETFLRRGVELTCAGRTDAGVHALSQYVSFSAEAAELKIPARRWLRAMDALLPRDIAVNAVFHAAPGFSARFDAEARTYVYRIADRPERPVLTRDRVWWLRTPLDDGAMREAMGCLVGEHDFKSFCKAASAVGKPTCRNVMEVGFSRARELDEELLEFTITGNAFLHSMVRTIVGTLAEVGQGRREPGWVAEALAACDRAAAGPTAPADGLVFRAVRYPEGSLTPAP